jgi:hypothetical protein
LGEVWVVQVDKILKMDLVNRIIEVVLEVKVVLEVSEALEGNKMDL